jgi:hypothetical protein
MPDESKRVLVVKLRTRDGGHVIRYAEVDAQDYDRWSHYFNRRDFESMKREAPKVLRMQITAEEANRRMNNDPSVQEAIIFGMGHVFADEVLP